MEINLLKNFPKVTRHLSKRWGEKTEEDRAIARTFGKEFFDGDRKHGYGGYYYHPRFWSQVAKDMITYYDLKENSSILDIGCAKGFLLHDFLLHLPSAQIAGIDISDYAISQALPTTKEFLQVSDARKLPFPAQSFDLVLSINTIHNFEGEELLETLREIIRVSKKHSFVYVDGYRTEKEKEKLLQWNLTAKSILHVNEWEKIFKEAGYQGDYYWFIP